MAIEKVREYFRQFHMEDQILEFDVSSATVELAVNRSGLPKPCLLKWMGTVC